MSRASQVHHVPQIGSGPDWPGGEHHRAERHAYLSRGSGKAVEPGILQPEVECAGHSNQGERQERAPGGRHVEVENLLGHALARFHRGVPQGKHIDQKQPD